MSSKLKQISNVLQSSESEIKEVIQHEKSLKKKKPYKSKLRPYLVEINELRKHGADWAIISKWLRVNKKIKMTEEGIRSFYHRNKYEITNIERGDI